MGLKKIVKNAVNSIKKGVAGTRLGLGLTLGGLCSILGNNTNGDTHYVSTNGLHNAPYTSWTDAATNVQAAVDSAGNGDNIQIDAGRFLGRVGITNKSLNIIGQSPTNSFIHYNYSGSTSPPVVNITGPCNVKFSNFEINGAYWTEIPVGRFVGVSPKGIVSSNANLNLEDMIMNNINNYYVTFVDGNLNVSNVAFYTRNILSQCDIGFQLKGCNGTIKNFRQENGQIDHTININDIPANHSGINIEDSVIKASNLSYGDCIRTYVNSDLIVRNCYLYRPAGQTPAAGLNHTGVSINGYSNNVNIINNIFDGVPWAIFCTGSLIPDSNRVKLEENQIRNCENGGIAIDNMKYKGIDLGGGNLGSRGGNNFSHTNAPTNYVDVLLNDIGQTSTANIWGLNNTFSSADKEERIYDKLDNPSCGRLITSPLEVKSASLDGSGNHVLKWNERGALERYAVETTDNLISGTWSNAPGSWPITNSSLVNDMCWTNTYDSGASKAKFYRIYSQVP